MPLQYLTREELYERIWEAPMTAIAQPLGIPASKLTEYALEMAVPRPPTGYWTKRRADKAVLRPPLPRRPPGAAAWVESGAAPFWNRTQSEVLADPLPPPPVFTESLEELGERLASQILAVEGASPGRVTLFGEGRRRSASRERPGHRPASPDPRRAFLIRLSAFLAGFVVRPEIREREPGCFSVQVHAITLEFRLSPKGSEKGFAGLWLPPADITGAKTHFSALNDRNLDAQLPEIGLAILLAAETSYRHQLQSLFQRRIEDRHNAEERVRQRKASVERMRERQRREQAERRRDRLFDQADDWRTARDIRGLVAEVMSDSYGKRKTRHLQAWADWALSEADLIDPVKQGGLVPPAHVRKAMREKLSRRPTGGTGAASSEPGAEMTSPAMNFAGCRTTA